MASFHKKSGDNFADKAVMLGIGIERQCEALNKMYEGKVKFCIETYIDHSVSIYDDMSCKDTICISWSSEETSGLDLPECEFIHTEKLFSESYTGSLSLIRLPKCIKQVDMKYMDPQIVYLNTLVLKECTSLISTDERKRVPGMIVIEKSSGNNKVYKFGAALDRHKYRNYHYAI